MTTVDRLAGFLAENPRLAVLTGAGCSTASGIPDYRDAGGQWKQAQPVQFSDFLTHHSVRQRYWARSMLGWPRIAEAVPNAAHEALVRLENAGYMRLLVTQNVDGLHQKAGSNDVIDLHGRLDSVACLDCSRRDDRSEWQRSLRGANPDWVKTIAGSHDAPDGDAFLEGADYSTFAVPDCPECGGIMKPQVVFFGEPVPTDRVTRAMQELDSADALLVVGSSLIVYSGYRFARRAANQSKPIALINRGFNRADSLAALKLDADCGQVLSALVDSLTGVARLVS